MNNILGLLIFLFVSISTITGQSISLIDFSYSEMERLDTTITSLGDTLIFQYDQVGNIISKEIKAFCHKTVITEGDYAYGTLRNVIACTPETDTVRFDPVMDNSIISLADNITLGKSLTIMGNESNNMLIRNNYGSVFLISPNKIINLVEISMKGNGNEDMKNEGTLILQDVEIEGELKNEGSGQITVKENVIIKDD